MKTVKIFFAYYCILNFSVNAQTLTGRILGESLAPIESATILIQTIDSVFLNAAISDSLGFFSIILDKTIPYRLIIHHLLYEDFVNEYNDFYEKTIQLIEKENPIGEVVVKGNHPIVRLKEGKLTYDLPRLINNRVVSNAYEALLHIPGVREQDGILVLTGTGRVTIIVNGQLISMPQKNLLAALKMYPANFIQSVEVMYSTPPQYHIRGASINLVIEDDGSKEGLQGQINTGYTQKYFANYNVGISFLLNTKKVNTDFNYGYSFNHIKTGTDIFSNHLYDNKTHLIEQINRGIKTNKIHDIRLGLDYKITDKSKISMSYTSQITPYILNEDSSIGTISISENFKEKKTPRQLHNFNVNYLSRFGLVLGTEFTYFTDNIIQFFSEKMNELKNDFTANANQRINRFRFYTDQSHVFKSHLKINYGAQFVYAKDESFQIYDSQSFNYLDISNRIDEHIANIYFGISKNFNDNLSLSVSLSEEFYKLGDFNKWTIFPTFEATYYISKSNIMMLSFSSDRIYPDYWEFHGAIGYMNSYAEIHGNPLLKPYKDFTTQFNYIINNKYIFTSFYIYMDDYFAQLPYQSDEKLSLIYKTQNFDYKQQFGISFITSFKLKLLDTKISIVGYYDKVASNNFYNISFKKENLAIYTGIDNSINLSSKPNIKLEINGAYASKNIQGPVELTNIWKIDMGIKWLFLNEMAEMRIKGNDIFNSFYPDMKMKYNVQNMSMNLYPDNRSILLSFLFKFGGYTQKEDKINSTRFGTK